MKISLRTENWEINNIEAILFDKDGTFIDLHYFWGKMTELRAKKVLEFCPPKKITLEEICFILGYDLKTKKMLSDGITALYSRKKIINIFCKTMINKGVSFSEKEIELFFDNVSQEFYQEMWKYIKPIPEAIDFIKKLSESNIKLGIVTADSLESTNLALEMLGIKDCFKVVIGRESCIEGKESGIPVKLALDNLGVNPKNSIMIGDAPTDFIAANNAGIDNTILVSTGQVTLENLMKISSYVVKSLEDVQCLVI